MTVYIIIFAFIVVVLIVLISRSGESYLKIEAASAADVQGTFTLLLYGCSFRDDLANIAVFDREGDPYSFEIRAPDTSFTRKAGLRGAEAMREAERFVRCNIRSERSQLRRVLSPAGAAIGFELRPLYPVTAFGKDDVLDVRYVMKNRTVIVHVGLDRAVALQRAN